MEHRTPLSERGKRSLEHLLWRVEQGKKNGEIVGSMSELRCYPHTQAVFKVIGSLPGTMNAAGESLYLFECEECTASGRCFPNRAYECHNCGIANGDPEERHFKTKDKECVNYYCGICGDLIGRDYKPLR